VVAAGEGWLQPDEGNGIEKGRRSVERKLHCVQGGGYATTVGAYFIPESKFARVLGLVLKVGTTYAC
jgi:hypothetical protein